MDLMVRNRVDADLVSLQLWNFQEAQKKRLEEDQNWTGKLQGLFHTPARKSIGLDFVSKVYKAMAWQMDYWKPRVGGYTKEIDRILNGESIQDVSELLHSAKQDYAWYHVDRIEWEKQGFDGHLEDEQWRQSKGPTRAMANIQSALDINRSHLRPLSTQEAQLPVAKSTLQATLSLRQREQGVGIMEPEVEILATRALREEVEEATFGIVRTKTEELDDRWWEAPTLNTHTPHQGYGTELVAGSSTLGREGSVTDHPLEAVQDFEFEETTGWELMQGVEEEWAGIEGCYPDANNSDGTC